jgi:hypothetical protein
MMRPLLGRGYCILPRRIGAVLLSLGVLCSAPGLAAQDTPLISGGLGFLTFTNGGVNYQTIAAPLLAAPIGPAVDYFCSAATRRYRGALWTIFAPAFSGRVLCLCFWHFASP